jgi:hypothetical protein
MKEAERRAIGGSHWRPLEDEWDQGFNMSKELIAKEHGAGQESGLSPIAWLDSREYGPEPGPIYGIS